MKEKTSCAKNEELTDTMDMIHKLESMIDPIIISRDAIIRDFYSRPHSVNVVITTVYSNTVVVEAPPEVMHLTNAIQEIRQAIAFLQKAADLLAKKS